MTIIRCPECGASVDDADFACSGCELILNPGTASGVYPVTGPGIVEALLSPSDWSGVRKTPEPPPRPASFEDQATVRTTVLMDEYAVPRMVASLDLVLSPLHPFEARVASFLDGTASVPELARVAELPLIEVQAVLRSLLERRIIELHRHEPEPSPVEAAPASAPVEATPVDDFPPAPAPLTAQEPVAEGTPQEALLDPDTDPGFEGPARDAADEPVGPPRPLPLTTQPAFGGPVRDAPDEPVGRWIPLPRDTEPSFTASGRGGPQALGGPEIPTAVDLLSGPPTARLPAQSPAPVRPSPVAPASTARRRSGGSPASPEPGAKARRKSKPKSSVTGRARPPPPEPDQGAENVIEQAITLERGGEVNRAIEVLKRGMARVRDPAPIYNKLALILLNQRRDYRGAEDLLRRAIDLEPENSVYEKNLGRVVNLALAAERATRPR